jgi:hypothetical protein
MANDTSDNTTSDNTTSDNTTSENATSGTVTNADAQASSSGATRTDEAQDQAASSDATRTDDTQNTSTQGATRTADTPNASTSGETLGGPIDPGNSAVKDPETWVTGDEPMTASQRSYLDTLAREAGEEISADITKAQASEEIDRLQQKTGRGA